MAQEIVKAAANFIHTLMMTANNHMQINSPATIVHEMISDLAIACGHDAPPHMEIVADDPQAFFMFMTRLTAQLIRSEVERDERGRHACMRLILEAYTGILEQAEKDAQTRHEPHGLRIQL